MENHRITSVALAAIALTTASALQMGAASAPSPPPFSVGPEESVATRAEIKKVLKSPVWPDSSIGVIDADAFATQAKYWFVATSADTYGTAAVVGGSLDHPVAGGLVYPVSPVRDPENGHQIACYPPFQYKCPYTYAGSGSVYADAQSGVLVQFAHLEHQLYFGPGYQPFYSVIGTDISRDRGRTWSFLGEVVTPHVSYYDWLRFVNAHQHSQTDDEDIGPATYAVVTSAGTPYFYVYFNEYAYPITSHLFVSAARAPVSAVVGAAKAGKTVAWEKYSNGGWTQPGTGGLGGVALKGNPQAWWLGIDVKFDSSLGEYLAAASNNSGLYLAASPDAVHWSAPAFVAPATKGNHELVTFPSLIGTSDSPAILGRSFYIYWTKHYDEVYNRSISRRLITLK